MAAVRFGQVANPFSRPVTLALERGYFEDAGVELDVTSFPNGSVMSAAMARGEVDAGVGGHLQTLDHPGQVFFGPLGFERAPDHLPIALVSSVGSGRELEGKAVGVSARAAISELQLRIYMAGEGAEFERLRARDDAVPRDGRRVSRVARSQPPRPRIRSRRSSRPKVSAASSTAAR